MRNQSFDCSRLTAAAVAAGLLLAVAAPSQSFAQSCYNNTNPNLVVDGGFEGTKNVVGQLPPSPWAVRWKGTLDSGKPVDPNVAIGDDNPHDGTNELDLGTKLGVNDIYQLISGTVAGNIYTVCFWLSSAPAQIGGGGTTFDVLWNDVSELELTQSAASPYQYYSFNVIGTNKDHLRFRERNDNGYYYLDDIAIQLCTGCSGAPGSLVRKK